MAEEENPPRPKRRRHEVANEGENEAANEVGLEPVQLGSLMDENLLPADIGAQLLGTPVFSAISYNPSPVNEPMSFTVLTEGTPSPVTDINEHLKGEALLNRIWQRQPKKVSQISASGTESQASVSPVLPETVEVGLYIEHLEEPDFASLLPPTVSVEVHRMTAHGSREEDPPQITELSLSSGNVNPSWISNDNPDVVPESSNPARVDPSFEEAILSESQVEEVLSAFSELDLFNTPSPDEITIAKSSDFSDIPWMDYEVDEGVHCHPIEEDSCDVSHEEDAPIFEGAPLHIDESFAAIMSFAQTEHISGAGLQRLLELIALHLPQPNNFFKTTNNLFKMLEGCNDPVEIHFFCSNCYKVRSSSKDLCDHCTDNSKVSYFISIPLVSQLTKMYNRPDFVKDLQYKHNRVKQNPLNIEDIYDGKVYKEAEKGFLSEPNNISFMWNTDGVPLFNSTTYSLWPWFLVINELPPNKRFRSENMLVAGMWGSVTKPHPNIFPPIYRDLKTIERGVQVKFYGDNNLHTVKGKVLCGTCDAPARATFLNMKSHAGFYSCPVCKIRGETFEKNTTVFPFDENPPLRRMGDEYNNQVQFAVENRVLKNRDL